MTFARLDPATATPEHSTPPADKLVSGDPQFTAWETETGPDIFAGIWQATPGAWRVSYDEWEFCHILSGHSVLTASDGTRHHLRAGDSFVLRPGFSGTWEVLETTTKEYVIRP